MSIYIWFYAVVQHIKFQKVFQMIFKTEKNKISPRVKRYPAINS